VTVDRTQLARIAAPVLFLLAVTIAVLLVRSGLGGDETPAVVPPGTAQRGGPQTVVVRSGDTLEAIAVRTGTTVAVLTRLNPGLDPELLRVGQRIRVRP
jgi:LysM repeat protein